MLHIYTGEGKGKTTTAVGLAVRASKHRKVLFIQLIKKGDSSEIEALKNLPSITVKIFGNGDWILSETDSAREKENAKKALDYVQNNYSAFDVIILDEAITAVSLRAFSEKNLLDLIKLVQPDREIILTGRGATKKLIEKADLVTEMKKIKHYYDKGQKARPGIEY